MKKNEGLVRDVTILEWAYLYALQLRDKEEEKVRFTGSLLAEQRLGRFQAMAKEIRARLIKAEEEQQNG